MNENNINTSVYTDHQKLILTLSLNLDYKENKTPKMGSLISLRVAKSVLTTGDR